MIKWIRYWLWKRKAKKAIKKKLSTKCVLCNDPVVPGDFVAKATTKADDVFLVHAGFHFSLSKMDALCQTRGTGIGYWNGQKVQKKA